MFGRTVTAQKPSYQTYTLNRQSYYRSYQPPTYVYNMRPSYGMWDAMFMWMMLDNMNHNAYYHHRQDADWQAWRADANKQAETNAELKAKLAAMDAKVKELEGQKVPVNPAYMPEGVDPAIAVAPAVAEQNFRQEAPPQNPDAVDWTEEDNTGEVLLWIFGVMAAAFCIIGGAMWFMSRRRSNSFRSNYWN